MLNACLPLLVALLVYLLSTVTAQTQNQQQLDISGSFRTNPASPGDIVDKNLSKHPTLSVEDTSKLEKSKILNLHDPKKVSTEKRDSFNCKDDEAFWRNSSMAVQDQRSPNIPQTSANTTLGLLPCPVPTDIAPCVCTFTETNEPILDCSAVESIDQLAAVFRQEFPFKQFKELRIYHNEYIQFLSDIFNGVSFSSVDLRNMSNLVQITNGVLRDSRNYLQTISVETSALDENTFPFGTLHEYPRMTSLSIRKNNIQFLPAFISSTLKSLIVDYGHITVLPDGEWNNLNEVIKCKLIISYVRISTLYFIHRDQQKIYVCQYIFVHKYKKCKRAKFVI